MWHCTVSQWQAADALHAIKISFSFGRRKAILKETFFWAALRIYKGTFLLGGAKTLANLGEVLGLLFKGGFSRHSETIGEPG